jgi:hypothetical protein
VGQPGNAKAAGIQALASIASPIEVTMTITEKDFDIEQLARMAARLAGRDPDEAARIEIGGIVAFDDVMWRYPDFLARADAAYHVLEMHRLATQH